MLDKGGVCAPSRTGTFKHLNTCLTFSELRTLAIAYNKAVHMMANKTNSFHYNHFKQNDIIMKVIPLAKFKTFRALYNALYERFKPVCGEETDHCWIEQDIFKTNYENGLYRAMSGHFRPVMKTSWLRNRRELLDTFDILKVMKQYEEVYPEFAFCGVFPIDFMHQNANTSECVVGRICHFDLKDYLRRGIKHMGVVLNFDPHDQPGSHWVGVYANMDDNDARYGFFYYDSYAGTEPKEVRAFYEYIERQFRALASQSQESLQVQNATNGGQKDGNANPKPYSYLHKPFTFQRNTDRHQYKDTECGMFSMYFLLLVLQNPKQPVRTTLRKHLKGPSDDIVNQFRDVFYRKPFNKT